jgi:protein required for attachment to host cells
MSITWIMVANASQAKLFAHHGPNKGLELVKEMTHPESREKAANLVSDRVGNFQGSGSYAQATSPKDHEAERFAQEVSEALEHGRVSNAYEHLVLIASAPFLGVLNGRLPQQVKHKISESINKDYTQLTAKELAGHLGQVIRL